MEVEWKVGMSVRADGQRGQALLWDAELLSSGCLGNGTPRMACSSSPAAASVMDGSAALEEPSEPWHRRG